MKLIVDGIIFEDQVNGGISRIYLEILPKLCQLDPSLNIQLITSGATKQPLPTHPQIKHTQIANPQRFIPNRKFLYLKRKVRSIAMGIANMNAKDKAIWHSTYFTLASNWKGLNVLTIPDMIPELYPSQNYRSVQEQFCRYRRKCIEEADVIICISESTASDLRKYNNLIAQKKIYAIHLAASETFRSISHIPDSYCHPTSKKFLLYVGGRQYYKNFQPFLKAYSEWELVDDVDLVIIGKEWIPSELDLLQDLKLGQNVHLLTMVNDCELAILYNLASAFVYPSLYEGFGIPLLEAMQCGCPIVASRIPSTVEVAGECPIYFDPANFETLLEALTLAMEENKDEQRINSGFLRAREFSWETCAKKIFEVYSNLLDTVGS